MVPAVARRGGARVTPKQRRELYAAWAFVVIVGLLGVAGLVDMAAKLARWLFA